MRTSYAAILVALAIGCSQAGPAKDVAVKVPAESASAQPAMPQVTTPSKPRSRRRAARSSAKLSFRRWAVICSDEARQAGLGDLVTAELSKAGNLQLVERDELEAATRELQLAAAMESQAAATRLKMGQLLKADGLLFLSVEGSKELRTLKVVVSESLCGARLRIEYLPYGRSAPAELSRRCADIVADVREHFAGGIRQIVGVSPLLSKNLVHDYDHLQSAYAKLLEAALTTAPNVAVIEIEEARAIGGELSRTGAALADRPTPLLVEGEYTVSQGDRQKPNVQFEFVCQAAGGQRRTVHPPSMPLSAAARFIVNDLPRQLLLHKDDEQGEDVSTEEQFQWLVARGEAFSQVGAWEQGLELLEAAVLLSQDDLDLRLKLLAGYNDFLVSRSQWLSGRPEAVLPPLVKARLAYMGHVEYLIRNRRLNGVQAVAAVRTPYPFSVSPSSGGSGGSHGSSQPQQDFLQPVRDAEERFMAEVYPQILQFPAGRAGENQQFTAIFHERGPLAGEDLHSVWLEGLVDWFVKERASRQYPTPHDLDFLFRLLVEYLPDRCRTPNGMIQFLENRGLMRNLRRSDLEASVDDDWVAFLRRLAESKNRMASLYGRFGLLNRDFEKHLEHVHLREPAESLLAGVEAWCKDYAAIDSEAANRNWKSRENLYNSVDRMRSQLVTELKQPANDVVRSGPAARRRRASLLPTVKLPPAAASLRFEEIELRGFKSSGFDGWLAFGDKCDVLWRNDAIAIVGEKGAAVEILPTQTGFHNACWDGRQIWVATTHQGIWVFSTEGRLAAKIGEEQGLPPADRAMVLHVLGPGHVCAAGSFGEHRRAWCAMVELGQHDAKVNVFFRATHVPPSRSSSDKDLEQVFVPGYFCEYDPGNGGRRLLLLDRGLSQVAPLAIDPATLKVSELNASPGTRFTSPGNRYTNRKGEILEIGGAGGEVIQVARPGSKFDDGTTVRHLEIPGRDNGPPLPVVGTALLEYRGEIFVPGLNRDIGYTQVGGGHYVRRFDRASARWFRIDPATFRCELLELGPTYPNIDCWYSVSNRYGLVGGRRALGNLPPRLFRVSVEERDKGGANSGGADVGPDELKPVPQSLLLVAASHVRFTAAGQVETRLWTSADGASQLWARLVKANEDTVVLEKEDGVRVDVLREKLSRADLDYAAKVATPER